MAPTNPRVSVVVYEVALALIPTIRYLTHLLTIVVRPPLTIISIVEVKDVCSMNEVNKRIPHVAVVLKINWQVEEVIFVFASFINFSRQTFSCILVRDVLDHQSRSVVFPFHNTVYADFIFSLIPALYRSLFTVTFRVVFSVLSFTLIELKSGFIAISVMKLARV